MSCAGVDDLSHECVAGSLVSYLLAAPHVFQLLDVVIAFVRVSLHCLFFVSIVITVAKASMLLW